MLSIQAVRGLPRLHLALFLALSLSPGNSLVSLWCDHCMLASLLWWCLTVPSLLFVKNPLICFLCCPRHLQNLSHPFHLKGVKMCFFILSECPVSTAIRCSTSSPVRTGMGDVPGFNPWRWQFISVCNQPPRSTQPFILSRSINWVVSCSQMCFLAQAAPSSECLQGEGLVWSIGMVVCLLAACHGSNCTLTLECWTSMEKWHNLVGLIS